MSKNDSLFSRRAEDEIDEALSWLETIDSSGDEAKLNPAPQQVDKNAYEVLPTWLKMDIRSDATIAPPVEAPVADDDNLSWLDSIASGLGGPLAEPPTMSWDETAIYTVSEADKKKALTEAADRIEKQLSDDQWLEKDLADSNEPPAVWPPSAEQLEAAIGDAENLKEVTDPGKGMNVADLATLDEDVTQVYAKDALNVDMGVSAEITTPESEAASIDLPKIEIEDEPLIAGDGKFVPDSTLIAEMPSELELTADDILDDAPAADSLIDRAKDVPELHSPLDEPTNIHGTDAETLRAAFPILESESVQDVVEEADLIPPIDDLINEPTIISLEPRGELGSEIAKIDVDDFDDAFQSLAESSADDLPGMELPIDDRTQIHPPNAGVQSQHDITQIFLPDDEELEKIPLDHAAAGITEIYLPDDNIEIDDALDALENPTSSIRSARAAELFNPLDEPSEVAELGMGDVTQIYLPDEDAASGANAARADAVEDVTQIFAPNSGRSDEVAALVDSAEIKSGAELTEIYLPDEDSDLFKTLDPGSDLLDLNAAELTEIYLPETDEDARFDHLVDEAAAEAHQADLTEIHIPAEAVPDVSDLIESDNTLGAAQDLTEIYLPDSEELDATAGFAEAYQPGNDDSEIDGLLEMAEAASLPDFEDDKTQIFQHGSNAADALETLHAEMSAGQATGDADLMSSGEPTQMVLPEDTREEASAAPIELVSDVTIISELPISDRWRALIDQNGDEANEASESNLLDAAEASSAELPVEVAEEEAIPDEIPEDPDEAMAWLEAMVRRQKDSPDKTINETAISKTPFIGKNGLATNEIESTLESKGVNDLESVVSESELIDGLTGASTGAEPIDLVAERGLAAMTRISPAVPLDQVNNLSSLGLEDVAAESAELVSTEEPMTEFTELDLDTTDELSDALMWLEGVDEDEAVNANDVTVELNQEDIARLLEEHLSQKEDASQKITNADEKPPLADTAPAYTAPANADYEDQPTMITEMPAALMGHDVDGMGDSKELDEALAWLEAFSEDDDSLSQPGELAANRLQKAYVEETVIPIYEVERLAAHAAYDKEDFPAIYESLQPVLAKKDPLGANFIAEDVGLWIAKHPDEPTLHRLLGEAFLQLKRFEKSARAFRRVIELT